jgi:hypothetical protein
MEVAAGDPDLSAEIGSGRTLAGCSDAANSGREPAFLGRCGGIGQGGALDPDQVGDGGRRDGMPAGARLPNVQRDTGRAAALFSWWRGPR